MSDAQQKGPMWMAVVAAMVQLAGLMCLSGGILGAILTEHELFDAAGLSAWAVVGATGVAAIANAVLLFFAARGAPIPAALPVALASLPWLVGLLGQWLGASTAAEAIANVAPDDAQIIAMMGFAEATTCRVLGAALAASGLSAAAVGLGLAALARRAPDRRPLAALMALLALPAAFLPLLAIQQLRGTAAALVLPSLALALAAALAAAGAGKDRPARSGGLAVAAACAGLLAYAGTATAAVHTELFRMLSAVANVDPMDRLTILATGSQELSQAGAFLWSGAALAACCAVAVLASAAVRAGGVTPLLAGAGASVLVALAVFGADRLVPRLSGRRIATAAAPRTSTPLPPLAWVDGPGPSTIDGVLSRDGAVAFAADRVELGRRELLAARMRPVPPARPPADRLPEALVAKLITGKSAVSRSPRFGVALGEGCTIAQVLAVAEAANDAGIATLALVGRSLRDPLQEVALEKLDGLIPLRLGESLSRSAIEVRLPGAVNEPARVRAAHFQGTDSLRVDADGEERAGFEVSLARDAELPYAPHADGEEVVGLATSGAVSLDPLLAAVARLTMAGYDVVLYPEGAPVARP